MSRKTEPTMEYIRRHYDDEAQAPVLAWFVEYEGDDDLVLEIYDQLAEMGPKIYKKPVSQQFLFSLPLSIALQQGRMTVVEKICGTIFHWSDKIYGYGSWVEFACRIRNINIVHSYISKRGTAFANDPEVLEVILREDFVQLMHLCLVLNTDHRTRLTDGRSLYEAALSDEMRELLNHRTVPAKI